MGQLGQFIINHWQLWAALLIILVLILINEAISQKNQGKKLDPSAVVDLMNNQEAVVIDLRDNEAFRAGHIINAIRASAEDFQQAKLEKYKTKPVILVCAKGQQSPTLASKLKKQGYTQVSVLMGGFAAWQMANLPVVKGNK